jgi:hypothetical protein
LRSATAARDLLYLIGRQREEFARAARRKQTRQFMFEHPCAMGAKRAFAKGALGVEMGDRKGQQAFAQPVRHRDGIEH